MLTREQLMWAGVLHAGPGSAVGGLTALEVHGLTSWRRDEITILLSKSHRVQPVEGIDFVQTRRPIGLHTGTAGDLPVWRVEPAALRMAKPFKHHLHDLAGGVQSLAEHDVKRMCRTFGLPLPLRQTRRHDSTGAWRYTDCEWVTREGRPVVLEVDGSFHYEVEHWEADMVRERDLVVTQAIVLRCTALEVRELPDPLAASLLSLDVVGLPSRSAAPGAPTASRGADDPVRPEDTEDGTEEDEQDWPRSSA